MVLNNFRRRSFLPHKPEDARAKNKKYIDSGSWKCDKSPSAAHYWVICRGGHMICKYCAENRQIQAQPDKTPVQINLNWHKWNKFYHKSKGAYSA